MNLSRGVAALVAVCLLPSLGALAADRIVGMTKPPPLSGDIDAMPLIADPADAAERRINAALRRFDAAMRKVVWTLRIPF